MEQLAAWPPRVLWVLLALLADGYLDDALEPHSDAVRITVWVILAAAWTAGLVALLVARTSSLTFVRVVVPAGLAAAVAATITGSEPDWADAAGVTTAALATVAVLAPWFTEAWVDGSSYGPEHRHPLRTPVAFAVGLVPVTWLLIVAGATAGPLLLASKAWLGGAIVLPAGWAVAWLGLRSMHQLARRWVVLVPAGLVLHDPLTMPEPQLFPRRTVAGLGPAPADSGSDDLTAGAPGLALQLDLVEPVDLFVRTRGRAAETRTSTSLLITPARPSRLLDGARANRIPVR